MPLGWIDTASESEDEIADPRSTFPKDIDFTGTTQEIYNSLMEGILVQPHVRNATITSCSHGWTNSGELATFVVQISCSGIPGIAYSFDILPKWGIQWHINNTHWGITRLMQHALHCIPPMTSVDSYDKCTYALHSIPRTVSWIPREFLVRATNSPYRTRIPRIPRTEKREAVDSPTRVVDSPCRELE